MLVLVPRVLKEAEEDETGRDGRVQHTQEDERGDHEGEGNLLEDGLQGAKGGGGHVLVADEGVDDGAHDAEDDDLANGA